MANYRQHNRQQIEMKMMCINDFVPIDHPARMITSIIDRLDLSGFDNFFSNDEGGHLAYPVKSLLSLLIYAFLNGNLGIFKQREQMYHKEKSNGFVKNCTKSA